MAPRRRQPAETPKPPRRPPPARARSGRSTPKGHKRKFLVVVDETPECESALAFAASRALAHGRPSRAALRDRARASSSSIGSASRRSRARKGTTRHARCSACSAASSRRWASSISCRRRSCARASRPRRSQADRGGPGYRRAGARRLEGPCPGPGPLVTTLAGGRLAGTFPVPITVVPGHLTIEEILALA